MFLFSGAKIRCFLASTVGISPKGVGENPYFFILCWHMGGISLFLEQSNEIFTTFALRKKKI